MEENITVRIADSPAQIERCFGVIVQLRTHLDRAGFVDQVVRQQLEGFRLAFLEDRGEVKAVAGFRTMELLYSGKTLYVDDLVTDENARSKGYGDRLFDWLVDLARIQGCQHFTLDSGVQRFDAHRFYFRKRMRISSYHFALDL